MEKRIGVISPRDLTGSRKILDFAIGVKELGYDYILAYDHVVLPNWGGQGEKPRYTLKDRFVDPLVLLGAIAAVAPGLELFTGVLVLSQRQTVLVARQAADVDILSNGMLRLGVGVGWNEMEYSAMGVGDDFHRRGQKIEQQVNLLRQLWKEEEVNYEGPRETVGGSGLNPKPIQRPIPIWMGGTHRRVINRVVRIADGWIPRHTVEVFRNQLLPQLKQELELQQRDMKYLPVMGKVNVGCEFDQSRWEKEAGEWLNMPAVMYLSISVAGAAMKETDQYLELLAKVMTGLRN